MRLRIGGWESDLPFLLAVMGFSLLLGRLLGRWAGARWTLQAGVFVGVAISIVGWTRQAMTTPFAFGFDLAFVQNAAWNLWEGRGSWSDVMGMPTYAVHSFFTLPLFAWILAFSPHPAYFTLANVVWGVLAAIPAGLLGREILRSREAGWTVGLSFLLLPNLPGFLLVECHPTITGPVFLLSYFYFREKRRALPAALCATLAAFSHEVFLLGILVEGAVEVARPEVSRRFGGVLLAIGSLTLGLFLLNRAGQIPVSGLRHYKALGGHPERVLGILAADPSLVASLVFTRAKMGFLFHFLVTLAFLPLLGARRLWIALPEVALVLLSDPDSSMARIDFFYTHTAACASFYAALKGLRWICDRRGWEPARGAFLLFCALLSLQFVFYDGLLRHAADRAAYLLITDPGRDLYPTVPETLVPRGATVLVQSSQDLPKFPRRRVIFVDPFLSPANVMREREGTLEAEYRASRSDSPSEPGLRVYVRSSPGEVLAPGVP